MMNTKTLFQLEDEYIGKKVTAKRDSYESEIADFMIGYQIRDNIFLQFNCHTTLCCKAAELQENLLVTSP